MVGVLLNSSFLSLEEEDDVAMGVLLKRVLLKRAVKQQKF